MSVSTQGIFMRSNFALIIFISLCSILFSFSSSAFAHIGSHEEIGLINEKLKTDPDNKELLLKRAYLFRLIGHHKDVLNELNRLIKKYPKYAPFYFERAHTHKEMSDYAQAETDFTQVIQLAGKTPKVLSERAMNREKLKRYQAAIDDYKSGSQLSQNESFYLRFGKLYQRLGHYQKASDVFRKALKQWKNSVTLTETLLRLEIIRRNYSQAQLLCDAALQKRRFKTPLLLLKGRIYEAAGQKEKAMETWGQALKECEVRLHAGKSTAIHDTYRAEVVLVMGNLEEANKQIESILEKYPDYSRASALKQRIESERNFVQTVSAKIFPDQDWTLLHLAAYRDQKDSVRLLIEAGAEVNANDKDGNSPLHIAALCGQTKIVQLLLKAGAAANVTNKKSQIPRDIAARADIIRILQETEAKTNKNDTVEPHRQQK